MKKSYVFIYNSTVGDRDTVKDWLNDIPEIIHWRFDIPNSFYLVSEKNAEWLAAKINLRTGKRGRFLITEYSDNSQGWLSEDSWYLLNNKKRKPKNA
jgi:hypothetical protein